MTTTFLSFFPAEFLSALPLQMLRAFIIQDPVEAAGAWIWVPTALWLIVILGYALPPLVKSASDLMRRESDSGLTTFFLILALAGAFYAFPSSASKGGGTNTPPPVAAAPVKRINLYYQDATGRLVPLGARIMEDK